MRRAFVVLGVGVGVLVAGCAEPASDVGGPVELPVVTTSHDGASADVIAQQERETAAANLVGEMEVPPRRTSARGFSRFRYNPVAGEIFYRLEVTNITNPVQAHIHIGPIGVNGPVVVFLFGPVPPGGGLVSRLFETGELKSSDLIGPLAGMTIADLWAEISRGNAYVNVHTDDGVAPPNTGPGDFPGGEVRGQIGRTQP
jgi:hypothetical protein